MRTKKIKTNESIAKDLTAIAKEKRVGHYVVWNPRGRIMPYHPFGVFEVRTDDGLIGSEAPTVLARRQSAEGIRELFRNW